MTWWENQYSYPENNIPNLFVDQWNWSSDGIPTACWSCTSSSEQSGFSQSEDCLSAVRPPYYSQTHLFRRADMDVMVLWFGSWVWCRIQSPGVLELNLECWRGHMLGRCSVSPFGLQLGGSTLHTVLINWRSPVHRLCICIDLISLFECLIK